MQVLPALDQYLKQKQWTYKPVDDRNIAIKTCPYCGKSKWKFHILARNGVFRCWNCNTTGNLYTLKKDQGDLQKGVKSAAKGGASNPKSNKTIPIEHVERWHKNLLLSVDAMAYLKGRGITVEAVAHFKLGLQRKDGFDWLAIPHMSDGTCYNIKFRNLDPDPPEGRKWRRIKGMSSILYNEDCLAEHNTVVIAEAELDAVSFWCAGIKNVVSLTAGAQTFLTEWYDQLEDKEGIITALDADTAGQTGARDIARRVGFDKTLNVMLPLNDANDVLMQQGPEALVQAVDRAEHFEVAGVLSLGDVFDRCVQHRRLGITGYDTEWADVNRCLGKDKMQPGDLVILSAQPGTGKTTWASNIAIHNANKGVPAMIYCLEMKPIRLGDKLASIIRRKPTDMLQILDFKLAKLKTLKMPLKLIDPDWSPKIKADDVYNKIREAVKRFGIKIVVFDHLHFLCRSLDHMTNEVGNVTKGFKLLAEELDVVVILIAQPGKVRGKRVMSKQDLKHSSDIPADADWVIILHRDEIPAGSIAGDNSSNAETLDPKTLIRFDKSRFQGGGECYLHYEGAQGRFMPLSERPATEF